MPSIIGSAQGVNDQDKSRRVRDMFGTIAGRYDFLNHFLSANIDRRWRKICVREVSRRISVPSPRILDVGCGTGDLSLAFSGVGPVIGCDFCHPMLRIGADKVRRSSLRRPVALLGADALMLPFANASFDVVVSAFVLRNLESLDGGLREMRRILRPGGVMGVLDFGMPRSPVLAPLYRFYFLRVLPKLGKVISGVEGPYGYLPASVQSFPSAEALKDKAEQAGFQDVQFKLLTAGVAVLVFGNAAPSITRADS
ncbi:MAG TPA: ubiquinone/menaquinone biosynthesis methyltransferase [Acidobacteriota bacterium]|nr:ubiquinone/menaquinone biosynthesis methyltransferase [Acidobacteriota bacterium]